jgi:hypothetical protein
MSSTFFTSILLLLLVGRKNLFGSFIWETVLKEMWKCEIQFAFIFALLYLEIFWLCLHNDLMQASSIKTCNRVCQWVKDVENEIFLLGGSPFSWWFPIKYCKHVRESLFNNFFYSRFYSLLFNVFFYGSILDVQLVHLSVCQVSRSL